MVDRICSFPGCGRRHSAKGLCASHYAQTRYGNPLTPLAGKALTFAERFWSYVDTSGDCWLWTGHVDRWGYGRFSVNSMPRLAHRVSYELVMGPIPEGMLVLHSCDNPPCVRPDHCRTGTPAENMADMVARGRNHPGTRNQHSSPRTVH